MIYSFILGVLFSALFITFSAFINIAHERKEYADVLQKLRLSVHHVATERPETKKIQADSLICLVEQVSNIEAILEEAKGEQNVAIIRDLVDMRTHLNVILQMLYMMNKEIIQIKETIKMMDQD